MSPSDWIAIGALIVAGVSIVFNYLTNKENIKARRIEIVAEKSIEAYRELVEKMGSLMTDTIKLTQEFNLDNKNHVVSSALGLKKFLTKYSLYFPYTLSNDLDFVVAEVLDMLNLNMEEMNEIDRSSVQDKEIFTKSINEFLWGRTVGNLSRLIDRIQKYVGVEIEETPKRKKLFKRGKY